MVYLIAPTSGINFVRKTGKMEKLIIAAVLLFVLLNRIHILNFLNKQAFPADMKFLVRLTINPLKIAVFVVNINIVLHIRLY